MLDRKNFIKEAVYNINKQFTYLSKLEIETAETVIKVSYGSIEAHMVILVIEKQEIVETLYFSEKPKDLYKEKDFSNLNLPDGRYLFDVPLGKVVYSFNDNNDINYQWAGYYVPTRFVGKNDDFICKLNGKFYRASLEVVGLAILKNITYDCLYNRKGVATNLGIDFVKRHVGINVYPNWVPTSMNFNGNTDFDAKKYPYLKKISEKI